MNIYEFLAEVKNRMDGVEKWKQIKGWEDFQSWAIEVMDKVGKEYGIVVEPLIGHKFPDVKIFRV